MILARSEGKYEITNARTGKSILVDKFYGVGYGDVAIVKKDGKEGAVNRKGTLVIDTTYEKVWAYDDDIIICQKKEDQFILKNNKGKRISKVTFESHDEAYACGLYYKGVL